MQRCPLSSACFRQGKCAGIKVESSERAPAISSLFLLAPVQTAGNHQMKNQPEIVVEAKSDALANAAEAGHGTPLNGLNWRIGGTQKSGSADFKVFQHAAQDTLLQRFHVNDNVWKFRHLCRFAPNLRRSAGIQACCRNPERSEGPAFDLSAPHCIPTGITFLPTPAQSSLPLDQAC